MLSSGGGLLAKIFAMLFLTFCPQRETLAANLAYTPTTTAPGQICAVRVAALDPLSGQVEGEEEVSLTPQPQQIIIDIQQRAACGLLKVVVTRLEGCSDPRGLRGISLEVLDALNGGVLRTMPMQVD